MPHLPIPIASAGLKIGLLGGSFNPAHEGHLHISLEALKRLQLDWVWWLVSPQNPLKTSQPPKPLDERIEIARSVTDHPQICFSDLEARFGTRYTIDTVRRVQSRWPATHFVWLMGADIVPEMVHWKDWTALFECIPIAIFDRPGYRLSALASLPAKRFEAYRLEPSDAGGLASSDAPAWCFLGGRMKNASSTALRAPRNSAT